MQSKMFSINFNGYVLGGTLLENHKRLNSGCEFLIKPVRIATTKKIESKIGRNESCQYSFYNLVYMKMGFSLHIYILI